MIGRNPIIQTIKGSEFNVAVFVNPIKSLVEK
jgi:hypothetical protein